MTPPLEARIRDREPHTLLEAYNLAVRLSSYDPETHHIDDNKGHDKRKRWNQNVNIVKQKPNVDSQVEEEIKELKESMKILQEETKKNSVEKGLNPNAKPFNPMHKRGGKECSHCKRKCTKFQNVTFTRKTKKRK